MNISLLTKYNNYFFSTRGLSRANRIKPAHAAPVIENSETAPNTAAHRGSFINHNPSRLIKRVGYTDLNGSWDQFTVSRFIELIERTTGGTLDAGAIMRKYDANGDGYLNPEEQTAMIEGLAKAENEKAKISRSVAENIIEQLKELTGKNETRFASDIQRAVRKYERLFMYENKKISEDSAELAV